MLVHIVSHVKHENRQNLVMFVQIDHCQRSFQTHAFYNEFIKTQYLSIYEVCYVLRALELLYIYF